VIFKIKKDYSDNYYADCMASIKLPLRRSVQGFVLYWTGQDGCYL